MRKKTIIIILALLFPVFLISQEEQEQVARVSHEFFPMQGSLGFGLDAAPFLSYLGNLSNGTSGNSLNLGDNTLYFRYFISDNAAVRLSMMVEMHRTSNTFYLPDDNALINDPLSNLQVEDRRTTVYDHLVLKAGYQHFLGSNRFRGFFGGDAGYGYMKNYFIYEYGNQMNLANPSPTTVVNWINGATGNPNTRQLERVNDLSNLLIIGAFTGAEYYILPRFALGLELGLQYSLVLPGKRYRIDETSVGAGPGTGGSAEITTVTGRDIRGRSINTGMPYRYGNLYLFFHF